jgi:hypothetical protein
MATPRKAHQRKRRKMFKLSPSIKFIRNNPVVKKIRVKSIHLIELCFSISMLLAKEDLVKCGE